jgi:hypothetical protein
MDCKELGHPEQALLEAGHCVGNEIPLALFDHCARTQRQEPHHGAYLEPLGTAVKEPQQVIIEAVLLIPHTVRVGPVHPSCNKVKMLHKLVDHILVGWIVGCELSCLNTRAERLPVQAGVLGSFLICIKTRLCSMR